MDLHKNKAYMGYKKHLDNLNSIIGASAKMPADKGRNDSSSRDNSLKGRYFSTKQPDKSVLI
jgi:hypothetical protein